MYLHLPLNLFPRGEPNVPLETADDGPTYLSERTVPGAHHGFHAVLVAAPRFPPVVERPIRFADRRPVHRPRSTLHGRLCPRSESRRDGPPRRGRDSPVPPVRSPCRGLGRSAAAAVGPRLLRQWPRGDDCGGSASSHFKTSPNAPPLKPLPLSPPVCAFF